MALINCVVAVLYCVLILAGYEKWSPKEEIFAIRNVTDTWHRAWRVISAPWPFTEPMMDVSVANINYLQPNMPLD